MSNELTFELIPGFGVAGIRVKMPREIARRRLGPREWEDWMDGAVHLCEYGRGMYVVCRDGEVDSIYIRGRRDFVIFGVPIRQMTRTILRREAETRGLRIEWEDNDTATLDGMWVWFDRFGLDVSGPEFVILPFGEEWD